jgi:hypothetical protein
LDRRAKAGNITATDHFQVNKVRRDDDIERILNLGEHAVKVKSSSVQMYRLDLDADFLGRPLGTRCLAKCTHRRI